MDENNKNNRIKIFYKWSSIFLGILIFLLVFKMIGGFDFFYNKKLKKIASENFNEFKNFINNKVLVTKMISDDVLLQSTLIQHEYKTQLQETYKQLMVYKQNFSDIRNISLFSKKYNLVLTSEVEEYIINKNLRKEWFLNAQSEGYYISDISYINRYNEYMVSIIYPIKNIINEFVGYVLIDFSLESLFKKFSRYKNLIVVLSEKDKIVFTYPLYKIVKDLDSLKKYPFYVKNEYDVSHYLITIAEKDFYSIPKFLKILLIFIFLIFILGFIYLELDKYFKKLSIQKEKFKSITHQIVQFSKDLQLEDFNEEKKIDYELEEDENLLKKMEK